MPDYARTQQDPFEYARVLVTEASDKINARIDHKSRTMLTVAKDAANHARDLSRNADNPGWVKAAIDSEREDRIEADEAIRKKIADVEETVKHALDEKDGWVKADLRKQSSLLWGILSVLLGGLLTIVTGFILYNLTRGA